MERCHLPSRSRYPVFSVFFFVAAVFFVIIVSGLFGYVDSQHQYGKHFIVVLPYGQAPTPSTWAADSADLHLVLTNPGSSSVNVQVRQNGQLLNDYTVDSNGSKEVILSASSHEVIMVPNGTSQNRTFVLKTATGHFGVLVRSSGSYDGYMAIPVVHWGQLYMVATFCKGVNSSCQIVVLAKDDFTEVTVNIPAENHGFRVDEAQNYSQAITHSRVLMQNEAWAIRKSYEMSGALVVSNASVGVLAGAQWTMFYGSQGIITEQLPPLTCLGQEYITLEAMSTVRVVSTEHNTTIHTSYIGSVRLEKAGQWVQGTPSSPVYIRASHPILVVEFSRQQDTSSSTPFPVFTVLTPITQFLHPGTVIVFPAQSMGSQSLVAVSRKKNRAKVLFGSTTLDSNTSGQPVDYTDYHVDQVEHTGGPVLGIVSGSSTQVVALYLLATSANGAYLSPLAARYDIINPKFCNLTTPQKAGDTVDNDCDGLVDEDDCETAGNTGIDCKLPDNESRDSWGRRFVAIIPEYISSLTVSVAIATLSGTPPVNVSIRQPGETPTNHVLSSTALTKSISLINKATTWLSGDRSNDVTIITSDDNIAVTYFASGTHDFRKTGGAMRLIPEDALGRDHYAVTICTDKPCQLQIVSVYPSNTITIHLKLGPESSTNLTFLGLTYVRGDVIHLEDVGEYEAVQLTCGSPCDMTGTRISASKPVAVFSISRMVYKVPSYCIVCTSDDHLMEQLPPVETYGWNYVVRQQPSRLSDIVCSLYACEDLVWIVSSEDSTTVEVAANASAGTVKSYSMSSAGDLLELTLETDIMQISSDRAVLAVHILRTLNSNDGAMLVVSPVSQYTNQDVIMFEPATSGNAKQVVMYTVGDVASPGTLKVDGLTQAFQGRAEGPLFNVSYLTVDYASGTVSTRLGMSQGGTFGGYVSILGSDEEIMSLSSGLSRINSICAITKPVRGDQIDNDCDGVIDEEPCPLWVLLDDDRDGRFNEDCDELPELSTSVASPSSADLTTAFTTIPKLTSWSPGVDSITVTSSSTINTPLSSSWSCIDEGHSVVSFTSTMPASQTPVMSLTSTFSTSPTVLLSESWSCIDDTAYVSSAETLRSSMADSLSSLLVTSSEGLRSSIDELTPTLGFGLTESWSCIDDPATPVPSLKSPVEDLLSTATPAPSLKSPMADLLSTLFYSFDETWTSVDTFTSTATADLSESWSCIDDPKSSPLSTFAESSSSLTDLTPTPTSTAQQLTILSSTTSQRQGGMMVPMNVPVSFPTPNETSWSETTVPASTPVDSTIIIMPTSSLPASVVTTTVPPDTTTADATTPEQTTPQQTTLEQTTPQQTTPKDTTTEDTTPDGTTPEGTTSPELTTSSTSSSSSLSSSSSGTAATPTLTVAPTTTTTTTTTTTSTYPHSLCSCNCPTWSITTSLPPESLTSVLNSIVTELTVDKTKLSSVRRKKISIEDDRPSAQTVGYFGVVIIIATALSIVILDSGALLRDLKALIASCKRS